MRKFGVLTGLAVGAAIALTPLASAAGDEFDFNSILAGEIQSMNFLFETGAMLAGVDSDDIVKADGAFDTLSPDSTDNEAFLSLLYGFNPDNVASVPGAYGLFNGATINFYDAFNVGLYAVLNDGDLITAEDLLGSSANIEAALEGGTVADAVGYFLEQGVNDIFGYFDFGTIEV